MPDDTLIQELRRTLGRMDSALGEISEGLILVDNAGEILWSNASFDALIGRSRLAILGLNLHAVLPLNLVGIPMLTFDQVRGGITKKGCILSILSRDPIHAIEVEWWPVTTEEPNPLLFVFRDISDRITLEDQPEKISTKSLEKSLENGNQSHSAAVDHSGKRVADYRRY